MSKNTQQNKQTENKKSSSLMFEFGDPEPVLSSNPMDYLGVFLDIGGEYYRPPVSLTGLAQAMDANPHHGSILHFKKNMILKYFIPSKTVSYNTMQRLALNYVVTGNFYAQGFTNGFGRITRAASLPAVSMRRGKKPGQFFKLKNDGSTIEFKPGEITHVLEPSIKQEVYGEPEYLGGLQAVLLSEDAGLFRRKYYNNGAHMGYILVTNDADIGDDDAKIIEKKITQSKGPGNFRSLYLNIGRSSAKEPVQVIPVGDISTKDEFQRVKNITRDEILSMHRMQPGLSGITPENTGGFGDPEKVMRVYYELEIIPMQQAFLELNEHFGHNAVAFKDPIWFDQAN